MRVLLDECVPWPIHEGLADHECSSVQRRGWAGRRNGDLLGAAEAEFDVFLTSDQNFTYQQNLRGRRVGVVVRATNDLRRLRAAADVIALAVSSVRPGDVRVVDVPASE